MFEITPQIVIALDVNVTYVQPYSRTTYANYVKFSKFDAGTTSILNRSNVTPEKADVKRSAGHTYVSESAYLPNLHISHVNQRKRHLAASVNMQLRYDGVRDLR